MKISLFTDTFYPEINGVATSCLNLMNGLTARGHEVHVFTPKCEGWEDHAQENVHYLPSVPLPVLKDRNVAFPRYTAFREALDFKPDVVHTNSEFTAGYFGRFVAKHTHSAFVHTYHTVWEDYTYYVTHGHADQTAKKLVRKYSEWWCERPDRIIVPTAKTEQLLRKYGVDSPIDIIPSGMELGRFAPARHSPEEQRLIREECGVLPDERVLVNIGRLSKEKELDRIVRLFPQLLKIYPDVHFVIIGEGPMREKLAEMGRELGLGSKLTVLPAKPWKEIDRYYAIGDVFASASRSETQGLTYIEAMASGLCVCAVDDPCLEGVIHNREDGVLCGQSDEALLEGLIYAFSKDGQALRQKAVEAAAPYSIEAFCRYVEHTYMKAMLRE